MPDEHTPVKTLRQELFALRSTLLLQMPSSVQVCQALIGDPTVAAKERLIAIRLQWRLLQTLIEQERHAERAAGLQAIALAIREGPCPTTPAALARTLGVVEQDLLAPE